MRIPWSLGKMNLRIVLLLFTSLVISTLFSVTNNAQADTSREQVSLNGVWDFYPNAERPVMILRFLLIGIHLLASGTQHHGIH